MIKCKLCNKKYNSIRSLGLHLAMSHNVKGFEAKKIYYDTYIKKKNEGICPVCGKPTKFKGGLHGYAITCSITCGQLHPETRQKMNETNLERYGATNPYGSKKIRKKIEKTFISRYGVKNAYSIPKIHEKAISHSLASHQDNGNHSSWETLLENVLIKHKIKYKKQYKDIRYPYYCDFYLPKKDLFIEINGFWMHGGHYYDGRHKEDKIKLQL